MTHSRKTALLAVALLLATSVSTLAMGRGLDGPLDFGFTPQSAAPAGPVAATPALAGPAAPCGVYGWDCPLTTPGAYVTEPTVHENAKGDVFVCGPNGVPSDSSLWRLPAGGRHFFPMDSVPTAPFGGGDCDFNFDAKDRLYMIDLWLGGNTIAVSEDGQSWSYGNPVTFKIPVGDRQWLDAAGDGVVYIMWRNLVDGIWVARSDDAGRSFPLESLVHATATKGGNLVIDDTDPTHDTVYVALGEDRTVSTAATGNVRDLVHNVYLAKTTDGGLTWTTETVWSAPKQVTYIFPVVALDTAGNPYMTWTQVTEDGRFAVFESHRLKDSTVWSAPV